VSPEVKKSDFTAKVHQIQSRLGLQRNRRPTSRLGSETPLSLNVYGASLAC